MPSTLISTMYQRFNAFLRLGACVSVQLQLASASVQLSAPGNTNMLLLILPRRTEPHRLAYRAFLHWVGTVTRHTGNQGRVLILCHLIRHGDFTSTVAVKNRLLACIVLHLLLLPLRG